MPQKSPPEAASPAATALPLYCDLVRAGDVLTCRTCGRPMHLPDRGLPVARHCRAAAVADAASVRHPLPAHVEALGLGDQVESILTTFGITKERVETWVGQPCGCAERREKLNRLGEWAAAALARTVSRLNELIDLSTHAALSPEPERQSPSGSP